MIRFVYLLVQLFFIHEVFTKSLRAIEEENVLESTRMIENRLKEEYEHNRQVKVDKAGVSIKKLKSKEGNWTHKLNLLEEDDIDQWFENAEDEGKSKREALLADDTKLWLTEKSAIPYVIDKKSWSVGETEQNNLASIIRGVLSKIEQATCLKFAEQTAPSGAYIVFTWGSGCTSSVGRIGSAQYIRLYYSTGLSCFTTGIIAHETLHALGFVHEQSRDDRAGHLKILWENIVETKKHNFYTVDTKNTGPLDYQSLMMYGVQSFSANGKDTIELSSSPELARLTGQRSWLSFYDEKYVNIRYKCTAGCTNDCKNDGYKFKQSDGTCVCKCPPLFEGTTCQKLKTDTGCGGIVPLSNVGDTTLVSAQALTTTSSDRKCVWLVEAPAGKYVRLHWNSNSLGDDCDKHYLEMRYNLKGQDGVEICGSNVPEDMSSLDGDQKPNWIMLIYYEASVVTSGGFSTTLMATDANDPCLSNPCYGLSTCVYNIAQGTHTCVCTSEYSGADCSQRNFDASASESFERGMELFQQDTDDDLDWTRIKGPTNSPETGPSAASKGDYYVYVEVTYIASGKKARLRSIQFPANQVRCWSFDYSMYGSNMGTVGVKLETNGNSQSLWTKSGDQGNKWIRKYITVPSQSSSYEIVFEYTVGSDFRGDAAIDNIISSVGECDTSSITTPIPTTLATSSGCVCDFEDQVDPLCGCLQHVEYDSVDWAQLCGTTFSTPSGLTGPTHASKNQCILYVESSSLPADSTSELKTNFALSSDLQHCVRFSYHMYGIYMGSLSLIAKTTAGDDDILQTITGDQGEEWHRFKQTIGIGHTSVRIKALFSHYTSDFAIDIFRLSTGACVEEPCDSVPCKHVPEGHCTNDGANAVCACPPGFAGNCDYIDLSGMASGSFIEATFEEGANTLGFFQKGSTFIRRTGSTASGQTGPDGAHLGDYYMYLEASFNTNSVQGYSVQMVSEKIKGSSYCLEFAYSMYGAGIGDLIVDQVDATTFDVTQLDKMSSQQMSSGVWKTKALSVQANSDFYIRLTGTNNGDSRGDIGVDSFKLKNVACS